MQQKEKVYCFCTLTLPSDEVKHSGIYKLVAHISVEKREKEVRLLVEAEYTQ